MNPKFLPLKKYLWVTNSLLKNNSQEESLTLPGTKTSYEVTLTQEAVVGVRTEPVKQNRGVRDRPCCLRELNEGENWHHELVEKEQFKR